MSPSLHSHSPSTTQSPKATLYSTTLDTARRIGLWHATHPATKDGRVAGAGGAAGMDWKELLRKFNKHNPSRSVTSATASLDLTLHQALSSTTKSTNTTSTSSLPPIPSVPSASHPALLASLAALDSALAAGHSTSLELNSARIVKAHALLSLGEYERAVSELRGVELECPDGGSAGEGWEGYDLVLKVVGSAVEGHALMQLSRPLEASAAYVRGARVYDEVCDILQTGGGSSKVSDVELHRGGEDVLYRLCLWSKDNNPPSLSYPHHKLYLRRSSLCPLPSSQSPYTPTRLHAIHTTFRPLLYATQSWSDLSLSNLGMEAILQRETKLPAAGESNERYLKFLDMVEEGWRRSGSGREGAREVVEIMYHALTHTFASHRLLRHLARGLVALGEYEEAGKALELYRELWEKSRETDPRKVARELRRFRREGGSEGEKEKVEVEEEESEGEDDFDDARQFVGVAVFAVRVFCRYLGRPERGLIFARRAREELDKEEGDEGLKADKVLEGRVEEALGVAIGALAAKEANPLTRPSSHSTALTHLQKAHALNPSSWPTLYHLAYQLAELRQVEAALEKARMAVSLPGGKRSREAWHLLGLLVGAKGKDWGSALMVLETALDEDDDEEEEVGASNGGKEGRDDSLASRLLADIEIDAASSAPSGLSPFDYHRDETEQLQADIQLRITKNVIIEVMEGPEAALLDQQSLLSYFSTAYALIKDVPEPSKTLAPTLVIPTISEPASSARRSHSILGRPRSLRHGLTAPSSGLRTPANGRSSTFASRQSLALEPTQPPTPANASVVSLGDQSPTTPSSGTVTGSTGPTKEGNPRATRLLVELWLLSAASYRRAGRLEDAKGAIAEAEGLDGDDPDVWVQLALYHLASSNLTLARTSLEKALTFSQDHPSALILLSRLYLTESTLSPSGLSKKLPFAEGILETLTNRQGWDSAEAWFELSRCFKMDVGVGGRRKERERESLVWALQLEETRGVRGWGVVGRVL